MPCVADVRQRVCGSDTTVPCCRHFYGCRREPTRSAARRACAPALLETIKSSDPDKPHQVFARTLEGWMAITRVEFAPEARVKARARSDAGDSMAECQA